YSDMRQINSHSTYLEHRSQVKDIDPCLISQNNCPLLVLTPFMKVENKLRSTISLTEHELPFIGTVFIREHGDAGDLQLWLDSAHRIQQGRLLKLVKQCAQVYHLLLTVQLL